jgi:cytochrome c553
MVLALIWPDRRQDIEKQLKNYKSKSRTYAPMNAIAAGLNDEDIGHLAAFFAAQTLSSSNPVDTALAKQGKTKAAMCLGCHGSKAEGRGQFPRLAGQKPQYLEKQLRDFKAGKRQGGPMNAIAKGLSEQDISALSNYFASIQ